MRDILYVEDAVEAYLGGWQRIDEVKGRAFNLGGGPANAVSLRQLLRHLESARRPVRCDRDVRLARRAIRSYYVSDARAASSALGLKPWTGWQDGVAGWCAGLPRSGACRCASRLASAGPRAAGALS